MAARLNIFAFRRRRKARGASVQHRLLLGYTTDVGETFVALQQTCPLNCIRSWLEDQLGQNDVSFLNAFVRTTGCVRSHSYAFASRRCEGESAFALFGTRVGRHEEKAVSERCSARQVNASWTEVERANRGGRRGRAAREGGGGRRGRAYPVDLYF